MLVEIAKFSGIMVWLVGGLMAADMIAMIVYALRFSSKHSEADDFLKQGSPFIPYNQAPGQGPILLARKYWVKQKVLRTRSLFVSDKSLVDGTATTGQRLLVKGIQLFFFLFWLLSIFLALSLLSSNLVSAVAWIIIPTIGFFIAATNMHKGRQNALRKLKKKGAPTH
jgi:hypothetical protein